MGIWSKQFLGLENLPKTCLMVAGGFQKPSEIREILKLLKAHKAIKSSYMPTYIAGKGKGNLLVVFGIVSAPRVLSMINLLHDGGCRKILFLGWAGARDLDIGSFILPERVRCLDGVVNIANPRVRYSCPDKGFFKKLKGLLDKNKIEYKKGTTVSVPVLLHKISHIEKETKKYIAEEMELSSLFYFSKKVGIKAAGLLIVSDNEKYDILKWRNRLMARKRYDALTMAVKIIKEII